MLPTPSTSHVDPDRIYEPAEDSFLFLDTISSPTESTFLAQRFARNPEVPLVLEVGTGSGVVLAFITAHAREILGRTDMLTMGVDINPFACTATGQTMIKACQEAPHAMYLGCLNADLSSCLRRGIADVVVFNPPYVPTAELPRLPTVEDSTLSTEPDGFEENTRLLSLSYSGGKDGMEVIDRLLDELPLILNEERGVAYILLCKQNKPESVTERIEEWGRGWSVEGVGQSGKTGGWEKLQILRICRTGTDEALVTRPPLH